LVHAKEQHHRSQLKIQCNSSKLFVDQDFNVIGKVTKGFTHVTKKFLGDVGSGRNIGPTLANIVFFQVIQDFGVGDSNLRDEFLIAKVTPVFCSLDRVILEKRAIDFLGPCCCGATTEQKN
jgi:hypothetical protein